MVDRSLAKSELGGMSADVGDRPTCVIMSMLSHNTNEVIYITSLIILTITVSRVVAVTSDVVSC